MTRDRYDLVMQHCADLGIEVEWAHLGDRRRGEYRRHGDRIILNHSLTARQAASSLAHECGHQRFGDSCSSRRNESRAWEYGAAMLITPYEYRRAEDFAGHHPAALAIELGVTPKLIEAWRRWWHKRGRLYLARCDDDALGGEAEGVGSALDPWHQVDALHD